MKKLQPDKLEPKSEKCVFIGYPKETVGYTFYHRSEGKIFVAKNGSFLEKEFLSKEVSGRKVELDEVIGLSQSAYLDKVLKKFKMDQAKKGFLPVLQGVKLSQTQCPTTA